LRDLSPLNHFEMEINSHLIIDRLSQRMDLDRVYLFKYEFLDQEYQHLVIALKSISGLSHKVLKPIVELCLMDQEYVSFELVPVGEMLSKIKTGSLYYSYASLPEYNIYFANNKNTPTLRPKELKSVLEISAEHYQNTLSVSAGFLEGAETFAKQGKYQKAVFMLHQSLENHLRLLQIMIDGKANNVHHISNRIKSLAEHLSTIRGSIIGKDEAERVRFKLLDTAFNTIKQNKELEISAFDASWLYDHCKFIISVIEQVYMCFMNGLQLGYEKMLEVEAEKLKEPKTVAIKKCGEPIFHAFPWPEQYQSNIYHLLRQIRQENSPEQIMMLNYYVSNANGKGLFDYPKKENGTTEIYLVVIKKKIGHCHFRRVSYGQVTAIVVFLNTNFIETKLQIGSRFSNTIWDDSVVLYHKPGYKPTYTITPVNWSDTLLKTSVSWKRNSRLIQDLLHVFSCESVASPQLAVLLLNQMTSIGLHSYLYLRIGYAPMHVTPLDLVDWTCICDKKVKVFFEPKDNLEEILNSELLKPMKGRVYELPPALEQLNMGYFQSRAKEIADFFIEICDRSLEYMELKSGIEFNKQ